MEKKQNDHWNIGLTFAFAWQRLQRAAPSINGTECCGEKCHNQKTRIRTSCSRTLIDYRTNIYETCIETLTSGSRRGYAAVESLPVGVVFEAQTKNNVIVHWPHHYSRLPAARRTADLDAVEPLSFVSCLSPWQEDLTQCCWEYTDHRLCRFMPVTHVGYRSGYFQLRQLHPIIRSLTMEAAKTIVQAFISCRLDYCNSLLYGISDSLLQRLQSVQNAARTSCHWHAVVWSYNPSSSSVALVTSPPANSFQDCRLGFPRTDRPSTGLPRRRLPPDIRLGPTQTPLFWH